MRLDRLDIARYRTLIDFSIDFDEGSFTTVLVGRNGTGKSILLEALIIIFRDLDLNDPPAFKYELWYKAGEHNIHIDADPARNSARLVIHVDKEPVSYQRFVELDGRMCLPRFLFGYYSGASGHMEALFDKPQRLYYRDLIRNVERPLRRLFYARTIYGQFVLLSFFLTQDETILSFLQENLRITGLDSILFVMREPMTWTSKSGDPRFWNAHGVLQDFLDKLYGLALAPLRREEEVRINFRKNASREHLYLYLPDVEALRNLAAGYLNQQDFFKALESTYISELISEIRIRVSIQNVDGTLTFRDLSEGEQQLLLVLGLLRFTKEREALFILDEPDTHLNPAWSIQYLKFINDVAGELESSYILMTTHSPLTIAGLEKEQVQIMTRDADSGQITAQQPELAPKAMDVAAILTSDLFGLRSLLNPETLALLDRKRELTIKEKLSAEEGLELERLNSELDTRDITSEIPDPLYGPFVRAFTEFELEEGLQGSTLTPDQQERRQAKALEILRNLTAEEADSE